MAESLRIERREYKYLVDETQAERIRRAIRPFCTLDPYAAKASLNRYPIESLYLDTPDLALYRKNDLELVERYKLRVRRYPGASTSPFFLELKARYHDAIVKTRAPVGPDWASLVSDPFVPRRLLGNTPALLRFVSRSLLIGARPTVLVRYTREAWVSTVDDYARITFDRGIEGQLHTDWSFAADPRGFRACDDATAMRDRASRVVLELKFTARVLGWMRSFIETLGLARCAYSKYGRSLESLLVREEVRTPRRPWLAGSAV